MVTAIICNEAFETSKCDEADMAKQQLGFLKSFALLSGWLAITPLKLQKRPQ